VIGRKVSEARKDLGWTQKELADEMGVDRQRIGKIESGKKCEINVYYEAAEAMGIAFEELVMYEPRKKGSKQ
jgi:transcriptional regulator with XRE-family HTH domain